MKTKPKTEMTLNELSEHLARGSIVTDCLAIFIRQVMKAHHEMAVEPAHKAIAAILAKPSGCVYCDSGELRLPPKFPHAKPDQKHDDGCGFAMAEAVLGKSVSP